MGNCLRLGISRVGLAWSKWRMAAKFKRKNVSIIILGMQAVGKSTIALRLYKFKKTLPDTNYVQTKGFNTYTVKRKKTTVNIYDLGGHPSIQELWDHYYADSHGVVFVVDTSQRETVPEAGQLLSQVLNDHRIRGKPVLLLANKCDLDGVTENELDTMLNLQQLVNSVRCMTRLDVSCATDLKDDKGIFEGFKWLISYIESNYQELNTRVLSDTVEEKNREKARRAAVKAARDAEKAAEEEEETELNGVTPGTPLASSTPVDNRRSSEPNGSLPSGEASDAKKTENEDAVPSNNSIPPSAGAGSEGSGSNANQEKGALKTPSPKPRPISVTRLPQEPSAASKIPLPLLPSISSAIAAASVDQPVKLPRLKSPKSKPEIINRIEETGVAGVGYGLKGPSSGGGETYPPAPGSDQYYDEKGFRFRKISAARRLSPEGADSDDGIINMAYEPSEDVSSDSTPIGVRKHNFSAGTADEDLPNKELFMITTLAEVHKEYFKDRKGSTSTHDSVSMSVASIKSDTTDIGDDTSAHPSLNGLQTDASEHTAENTPNKQTAAAKKGNKKKRLNNLKPRNKTGPAPPVPGTPAPLGTPKYGSPLVNRGLQKIIVNSASSLSEKVVKSRTPSASSKTSASGKAPFTVSNAWASSEIPEHVEMNGLPSTGPTENGRY